MKTVRQLAWELNAQVHKGKITEEEAARQLMARGGFTLAGALEIIRKPVILDEGRD